MRISVLVLSALVCMCGSSSRASDDVEELSIGAEEIDLSGTYPVSGKSDDTTRWTGEAKLSKWQTFTTQRGKTYQMLKVNLAYGETKYTGVAVFDGTHLFTACREGDKANYFLLILDKLELSSENYAAVKELHDRTFGSKRDGEMYTWKGDIPWYGHIAYTSEAFGLYFFADGTWGEFTVEGCGWPIRTDTTFSWSQYEMKKDGKFEKNSLKQWSDHSKLSIQPTGENVQIQVLASYKGGDDYVGHGMMVKHNLLDREFLVASMGGPDRSIVGYFNLIGNEFSGQLAWRYGTDRFKERWTVPENVVARDPETFK